MLLALAACSKERMKVVSQDPESTDYGLGELAAAVQTAGKARESEKAYAEFRLTVEALRPKFNQTVADQAERELVFMALGPLAAHASRSAPEQLEALALTVWPVALRVEPNKGETAWKFIERACGKELATECKHVVPDFWPQALSALVWRRLKSRAREALGRCASCAVDETYTRAMERYNEQALRAITEWTKVEKRASPEQWPRAGDNAALWSQPVELALAADGRACIDGAPIDEPWRDAIAGRRGAAEVLGVHLRSTDDVRTLRDVLRAASSAGYREIALVTRSGAYPWERREYRISAGKAGRGLTVRDADTIQVLVRALDVASQDGPTALRL